MRAVDYLHKSRMNAGVKPPNERSILLSAGECDSLGVHGQPEGVSIGCMVKGRIKQDERGYSLSIDSIDKAPSQDPKDPVLVQNASQLMPG